MVHREGRHCRFRLIRPKAKRVYLVGDFNQWSTTAIEMTHRPDGVWQTELQLPPGVYRFRYHVDGQWQTDFAAFGIERSSTGEWDSIVYIPEGEADEADERPDARTPVAMFDH